MQKKNQGFTLIELMVVIAIIGILASMTVPNYINWIHSAKITKAISITDTLKPYVTNYYVVKGKFPSDNKSVGIPESDKLLSPEVSGVELIDGAFHVTLSSAAHKKLAGKVITVRPLYVANSPKSPISWVCGNTNVPEGMLAAGGNLTNVPHTILPIQCRDLTGDATRKK